MGLNTTHNCWNGAYSSFNRFRYSLARQIDIDLNEYYGYGFGGTKDLSTIDHELMPLFNHSDCDGILTPSECKQIAIGLDKVLENFKEDLNAPFYFKESIIQFRDGCLEAYANNENVEFQ